MNDTAVNADVDKWTSRVLEYMDHHDHDHDVRGARRVDMCLWGHVEEDLLYSFHFHIAATAGQYETDITSDNGHGHGCAPFFVSK